MDNSMDLVRLNIPYKFIRDRIQFVWTDVLFGIENELLDPEAPSNFAIDQSSREECWSPVLHSLANAKSYDTSRPYVQELASNETVVSLQEVRDKWLYIVLAWIFENRKGYSDPLQAVEEVYADFDYPPQMADFVRYMPMKGPDLGSLQLNVERLYKKWQNYLEACSRKYGL